MGLQWRQSICAADSRSLRAGPSSDALPREWFAVQVWAGREFLSAGHLRLRGYEVFLPWYLERRRWSDRVKTTTRALFDGYLFCRSAAEVVATIVSTPGVIRIVGDRERALPVPLDEIEALQRIVDTRLSSQPWPFLRVGQRVRVEAGPLRGVEGVVLMVKDQHRLVVSVSLLQRSVAVDLAADWVTVPHTAWRDPRAD